MSSVRHRIPSKASGSLLKSASLAAAVLLALSGCGSDSSADSSLSLEETTAVLPDGKAVPEWKLAAEPMAYPQKKAVSQGLTHCYTDASCADVRFSGRSLFMDSGKPQISFVILSYPDAETAKSAFTPVWKAWRDRVPEGKSLDLGDIGEQSDAVSGADASLVPGSKGVLSQARVGSVILLTHGAAAPKVDMDDSLIAEFATMFAERARQAEQGETPSATVAEK